VAAAELASLMSLLQEVHLSDGKDQRTMLNGAKFSTKAAYDTLQDNQQDAITTHIWGSRHPGKIKNFGWFFHLNRLNTRSSLPHVQGVQTRMKIVTISSLHAQRHA
jgi:hypothetical protein